MNLVKNDIVALKNEVIDNIRHSNITKYEIKALKDLSQNDTITIKPADKGGGKVIMDMAKYIREIKRQLSEDIVYTCLNWDPIFSIKNKT